MTATKAHLAANRRWKSKAIDILQIEARKELCIPDRVRAAVEAGKSVSRQRYIIDAILSALERDGIPEAQHLDDDKTPEA